MTRYVALLRSANVGGYGKIAMSDLRAICVRAGFGNPRTFIASGNVVFEASARAAAVKQTLEQELLAFTGRPVRVLVRSAEELRAVLSGAPFTGARPDHSVAFFLEDAPPADALEKASGRNGEDIRLGAREIYVHYVNGIGRSKLRIPAAAEGTARNMNTIAKLMAIAMEP